MLTSSPINHHKPWTLADVNRRGDMIKRGIPISRAAHLLGRSVGACRRIAWAIDVEKLRARGEQNETLIQLRKRIENEQRADR